MQQSGRNAGGEQMCRGGPRLRIGFVLADRFTMSAFALFIDSLRLAADEGDRSARIRCDWEVLSSSPAPITSSCGVKVSPTSRLIASENFDYIAIVGGLLAVDEPLQQAERSYILETARKGIPLVGLCTGSFILAELGLLEKSSACVSWLHAEEFGGRFPNVRVVADKLYLRDGNVVTSVGGSSSADLAAHLIGLHVGLEAQKNALQILHILRAREGDELQPRSPFETERVDRRLHRILLFMEQNLTEPSDLNRVAKLYGMSRRSMERVFAQKLGVSPSVAYRTIRLNRARQLVLHSELAMIEIAAETGFENASHFSRAYKAHFGISPSHERRGANSSTVLLH